MFLRQFLFTLLISVVGISSSAALITSTGTKPSVGNGNSGNPYEIRTVEELRWFVHYENTRHWFPNDYAKLMADLDLSSICGPDKGSWIPLGVAEESGAIGDFYGNFDGNGHTVSGMYIDGKDTDDIDSRAGFFGMMTSGSVCDLTVEGDIINASYAKYTGGMVAKIETKTNIYAFKDLEYTNCEARVNIWFEDKGGQSGTLKTSNHYIGGFLGNSYTKDGITMRNCVFSGDINFDNASANSAVGAFIGFLKNNKTANLQYCSASTSLKLPFIQYVEGFSGSLKLNLTGCINRGPMAYKLDRNQFDSYFTFTHCIYSDRLYEVPTDDDNGRIVDTESYRYDDPEIFTNGFACYFVNTIAGGKFFTQTLGTDKMPFPGSGHKTVYRVKEYTSCANDDFVYVYSNSSSDITDKRQHSFEPDEAFCTNCHKAVNPDYGIAKDADGYYLAASAEDIKWLWNLVNVTGVTDAKIRLTADIDMAGEAMDPLAEFGGVIDGSNHRLDNINISGIGIEKLGLVSNLGGTVHNLVLSGNVEGSYVSYMGAVAGHVLKSGTVSNVLNECTVKSTGTMNGSMRMCIGGIAGFVSGKVSDCVNNGPVVDASTCTGDLVRYIAGVVGYASDISTVNHLVNNAVVGASSEATPIGGSGNAVANLFSQTDIRSYYVTGISNPGLGHFYSDTANDYDTAVSPVDVGSGRLAWLIAGKDYDGGDATTVFFGQTIGTDLVPYPFVSESHKGVYNSRHYYTCDSYTDYSNSPTDEEPSAHTWNDSHYCSVCCVIDPEYMEQDPSTKAYLVLTAAQYNTFAGALNAACKANKPMQYASASLQSDLDFSPGAPTVISCLSGRIHGNGKKLTLGSAGSVSNIATTVSEDGVIEYLDVAFPSDGFYPMVYSNLGRIVGCNLTRGVPAGSSAGLVSDCSGELPSSKDLYGRHTRCLVKTFTIDGAAGYRLYNSNVANNVKASYTEIPLEQGESAELAYQLSHDYGGREWGQDLGTDAGPRLYYKQTPTSNTFVARISSYSATQPEGKTHYVNAGQSLEYSPGYYHFVSDPESWTKAPWANFIADLGDGRYTTDNIEITPSVAHLLPFGVEAGMFTYSEVLEEGDIVSLILPVEIPASRINGKVYLFNGYNSSTGKLEFINSGQFTYLPANTPMLVKAYGGEIIGGSYCESYPLIVSPMTGSESRAVGDCMHLAGYLPTNLSDGGDMLFYTLTGVRSRTTDGLAKVKAYGASSTLSAVVATSGTTVSPFDSYLAIPASLGTSSTIPVTLVEEIPTGVEQVEAHLTVFPCEIWTLSGLKIKEATSPADLQQLAPGIYILVGKDTIRKFMVK